MILCVISNYLFPLNHIFVVQVRRRIGSNFPFPSDKNSSQIFTGFHQQILLVLISFSSYGPFHYQRTLFLVATLENEDRNYPHPRWPGKCTGIPHLDEAE